MRLGITEIDKHPIAHVLGDKTIEPADRVGDAPVISADNLAQILRVIAR
jgi:hypothetical protein